MAEYIDKKKLIKRKKKYVFQTRWGTSPKHEWFIKLNDIFDMYPADVVEREKIDKAIEEIVELGKEMNKVQFTKHLVPLDNILEILKRNIGE